MRLSACVLGAIMAYSTHSAATENAVDFELPDHRHPFITQFDSSAYVAHDESPYVELPSPFDFSQEEDLGDRLEALEDRILIHPFMSGHLYIGKRLKEPRYPEALQKVYREDGREVKVKREKNPLERRHRAYGLLFRWEF